jgi:hypothetical protein
MAKRMPADEGDICPFHKKDVSLVCHKCPLYMQIRGMDRNTGQEVDHWICAIAAAVPLMIENTQMSRETGGAVETFRNEMVKMNEASNLIELAKLQQMASNNPQIEHKGNANS